MKGQTDGQAVTRSDGWTDERTEGRRERERDGWTEG